MNNEPFADRIMDVPKSFIREILKVSIDPSIISFAGGLPNREYFPSKQIEEATKSVMAKYGKDLYQYSNSEGLIELRSLIAERYRQKKGIEISPEQILITSGGQQGLDLIGKVLLNQNDGVIIEEPGYLGAIQAFSIFRPKFLPVKVGDDGIDKESLHKIKISNSTKVAYTVPNFQNPSGITYNLENRKMVAEFLEKTGVFLIEDDPYGELRFCGDEQPSFYSFIPEQTILLGSFSKVVVPGFRVGWIVAPEHLYKKLLVAKQAADLHTCNFTQRIIQQFLLDNDLDKHIDTIKKAYGGQCETMLSAIKRFFPEEVHYTTPEGGMFLWGRLPQRMNSIELFEKAVKKKVVFVPGDPFYVDKKNTPDLRLNFSSVDKKTIEVGIERLGEAIRELM